MKIETKDIVLAAALKTLGHQMLHIEKIGAHGVFHMEVDQKVLTDYDLGNLRVEPIAFNAAVRALTTAVRRIV